MACECPRCDKYIDDVGDTISRAPQEEHVALECPHCGLLIDAWWTVEYVLDYRNDADRPVFPEL